MDTEWIYGTFVVMKKELTSRQAQVLHFLKDYQDENGRSATIQEICDHFQFRSLSSAQDHLRLMEKKGVISRTPHSSRSIRILQRKSPVAASKMVSVPLVGKIAAGAPIFVLEEPEEILALPKAIFGERRLFALRVEGDSMINAGIFNGDIAVLRSQPDFADGDIAAVVVNEEATLKRVSRTKEGLCLHSENDAYSDIIIRPSQLERSCRVTGILVGTIRNFN